MSIEKHNTTIEKKHEGRIIYAYPTGNNHNRFNNTLVPVKVVKVKIKYASLKIDGHYEDDYCIKRGCTQECANTGYSRNAGYLWYESIEDYEKDKELDNKIRAIEKFFRNFNWAQYANAAQIDTLFNAIGDTACNEEKET